MKIMLKNSYAPVLLAFVLVLAAAGCKKERLHNRIEGLWDMYITRSEVFNDGVLQSDTSVNVSNGQIYFDDNGTGWSHPAGTSTPTDWAWDVDYDNEVIKIFEAGRPDFSSNWPILDVSKSSLEVQDTMSTLVGPQGSQFVVFLRYTYRFDRAD